MKHKKYFSSSEKQHLGSITQIRMAQETMRNQSEYEAQCWVEEYGKAQRHFGLGLDQRWRWSLYMRQGVSDSSDPFLRLPLIANTWVYFDYTFAQRQKCQVKKIEGLKCARKLSLGTAFVSDSKIF